MFIKLHSKKTNKPFVVNTRNVIYVCIQNDPKNDTLLYSLDGDRGVFSTINESVEKVKSLLMENNPELNIITLHSHKTNRTVIINADYIEFVSTDDKKKNPSTLIECEFISTDIQVIESVDKVYQMLTKKKNDIISVEENTETPK